MVLEINTTQKRDQGITGRKPTAFFSFSGHVAYVDVCVYQNGWSFTRGAEGRWSAQAFIDYAGDMERLLKELADKKKELRDAGKM